MTDRELLELAAKDEVIAEAGEMLAMRDRQLAAIKAENEWQPIETAPTDGTAILVCHDGGVWIAKHKAVYQSGYKPDNPWFCLMLNKDHIPSRKRKGYPTHWMPLPKPPVAEGDEK